MARSDNTLYVAGWNVPGYLPESDPEIFDNETDAIRYLSDTVDLFWGDDAYVDSEWADRKWTDVYSNLPYETAPFNIQDNDGSLTFWVTVVPKASLPYTAEGN